MRRPLQVKETRGRSPNCTKLIECTTTKRVAEGNGGERAGRRSLHLQGDEGSPGGSKKKKKKARKGFTRRT